MKQNLPIIYTFGCRMNTFESNFIRETMKQLEMFDFIVVNSCGVTAESERQVRQEVRKLKKENQNLHLLITGCSSQLHTDDYLKMDEVDFVIGNEFKMQKKTYQLIKDFYDKKIKKEEVQKQILTSNKENIPENNCFDDIEIIKNLEDRDRAFVPIQTGCNHFCAFCIVPFTRGKFKSFNLEFIVEQIQTFIKNGYKEVVLTGIDITDYGKDIRGKVEIDTLGKLCKEILNKTNLERLRLSSVDVAEIDDDIMYLVKNEPRFMPYFHISLQSGSNSVLKRMRRRHTYEDVIRFCKDVLKYRPQACFGADIITGFPGETEEEFQCSIDVVKNAPITFVHAFPYSRRERTLAYLMDDNVSKKIKKDRLKKLVEIGEQNKKNAFLKVVNTKQKVLIENNGYGRLENFLTVKLEKDIVDKYNCGDVVEIVIKN